MKLGRLLETMGAAAGWGNSPSDKYTAHAELALDGGYFVRVRRRARVSRPLRTCLLMEHEDSGPDGPQPGAGGGGGLPGSRRGVRGGGGRGERTPG